MLSSVQDTRLAQQAPLKAGLPHTGKGTSLFFGLSKT